MLGAVLTFAMVMAAFVSFAIGVLAPVWVEAFDVGHAPIGFLVTAFFVPSALLSPVAGAWVDALGGRRVLIALFVVAALGLAVLAGAPGYPWLVVGVAVAGVGSSLSNPATNALVAAHVGGTRLGLVMGVKQSGVQLGSFLAGVAIPLGVVTIGWRPLLGVVAGIALTGALAASSVFPARARRPALRRSPPDAGPPAAGGAEPGRAGTGGEPATAAAPESGDGQGLRIGPLTAYALLMGGGVSALTTYLPLYGVEALGLTVRGAGSLVATMGIVATLSRIALGVLASRMNRDARVLGLLGLGSAAGLALLVLAQERVALAWAGTLCIGLTGGAWNAVAMLSIVRGREGGRTGRRSGLVQFAFHSGFVLFPPLVGILIEVTGDYTAGWAIVFALFASAAVLFPARDWVAGIRGRA